MRTLFAVLCLFGIAGLLNLPPARATPFAEDFLIVEGKSVGHARLNDPEDRLVMLFGKPAADDAAMGHLTCSWQFPSSAATTAHRLDVRFQLDTNGDGRHYLVTEILTNSPSFHTPSGISVGTSLSAIKTAFADIRKTDLESEMPLYDSIAHGIAFEINDRGRCAAIIIHASGVGVFPIQNLSMEKRRGP